jgi:hypothetical protein
MPTTRERRDMDDREAKHRQTTEKLKETAGYLKKLLDAAEAFAADFKDIKRHRRDHQLPPLTAAADNFVAVFTQIKLDRGGYKMPLK